MMKIKGFAVLELLVSLLVLAILAGGVWVWWGQASKKTAPTSTQATPTPTSEPRPSKALPEGLEGRTIAYSSGDKKDEFIVETIGQDPFYTGLTRAWFYFSGEELNISFSPDGDKVILEGFKSNTPPQSIGRGTNDKGFVPAAYAARGNGPIVDGLYLITLSNQKIQKIEGVNPSGAGLAWSPTNQIAYLETSCSDTLEGKWGYYLSGSKPTSQCLFVLDGKALKKVATYNVWSLESNYPDGDLYKSARPITFLEEGKTLLLDSPNGFSLLDLASGRLTGFRTTINAKAVAIDKNQLPLEMRNWYQDQPDRGYLAKIKVSSDGKYRLEEDEESVKVPLGESGVYTYEGHYTLRIVNQKTNETVYTIANARLGSWGRTTNSEQTQLAPTKYATSQDLVKAFEEANIKHDSEAANFLLSLFAKPATPEDKEQFEYLQGKDLPYPPRLFNAAGAGGLKQVLSYTIKESSTSGEVTTVLVDEKIRLSSNTGSPPIEKVQEYVFEIAHDASGLGGLQVYRYYPKDNPGTFTGF